MNMAKKLARSCAAGLLACMLMLPMAAWADDDTLDATVSFGEGGAGLTIPAVSKSANSLLLKLTVEPGANAEGQPYDIEGLSFNTALQNLKVNDVTVDGDTIQVVLSAGTSDLFAGASGSVDLGTLSMQSPQEGAEATVRLAEFETLDANYVSTSNPGDTITAVYHVNEAPGPNGGDGNGNGDGNGGNGGGNGNGAGGNGNTIQTGYGSSSAGASSGVSQTGDAMMYGVTALVVVAAASGVLLLVRAKRSNATKER